MFVKSMSYRRTYQHLPVKVKTEVSGSKLLKTLLLTSLPPLTPYRGGQVTDNLSPIAPIFNAATRSESYAESR